jgi:hypothetical protein
VIPPKPVIDRLTDEPGWNGTSPVVYRIDLKKELGKFPPRHFSRRRFD